MGMSIKRKNLLLEMLMECREKEGQSWAKLKK